MRIALDAMGSDEAPGPELAGARLAVEADPALEIVLVGDGVVATHDRIRVVHAAERITAADHPAQALRGKPGSSLHVAIDLVAAGDADAVVSAGNSGAVLALAKVALPLAGPSASLRPAIVAVLPAPTGPVVLCDAGANVEPRPAALARFAAIGAAYDRIVHGRACPRVGLLANGSEPSKGTAVTREAHALLTAQAARAGAPTFRFVGYVEGSDLFTGVVDVVTTDGFTGNVVLKTCEGIAEGMFGLVRRELDATPLARLGAAIVAPALRNVAHQIDYTEVGGALLAGVARPVVIAHGRSDAAAIASAIRSAATFVACDLAGRIAVALVEPA
jgi:glycerol-3-phosphate acyltransferase PlsX